MSPMIFTLGESDCESIGGGFLAQPVNAISSLTFSVIGIVLVGYARRVTGPERTFRYTFAAAMIATGIGSFLFHGPQGDSSHFLHDITFLLTLVVIGVANIAAARSWSAAQGLVVVASFGGLYTVVLLVAPSSANVLAAVSAALVVAADVMVRRLGAPAGRWYLGAAGVMALAVVFFVIGRTGGPMCDSISLIQGHALWHALSAFAVASYFVATSPPRLVGFPR